jgi:hypothetical protein
MIVFDEALSDLLLKLDVGAGTATFPFFGLLGRDIIIVSVTFEVVFRRADRAEDFSLNLRVHLLVCKSSGDLVGEILLKKIE